MTTHTMTRISTITILLVGSSVTQASEPNDGAVLLRFEVHSTAIGPLDASRARRSGPPGDAAFAAYKPAYAAGIPFEGPTRYLARPGSGKMNDLLHFAQGEVLGMVSRDTRNELSTTQREFLHATKGLLDAERQGGLIPQWHRPQDEPNGPEQLLLYAVTPEDAKRMAQVYCQYTMSGFRRQIDELHRLIGETTRKIAEEEKRISEIEELTPATQKSLEETQKLVPYRTESEARAAIGELDRMLNAAQVDIAGIKARIAAIQGYQQEKRGGTNPDAVAGLEMMFIQESVALHGVEARRQMATKLRTLANQYVDLRFTLANAASEKETLTESLKGDLKYLTAMENQLKSVRTDEPKIPDKVAIYPVQWAAESEGSSMMGPKFP